MNRIIEVVTGGNEQKVYAYTGKFAPYSAGLTIGEIIQGLPDPQTARMCLTDIMAELARYEEAAEENRLAFLPFASSGLLTVSGGYTTLTGKSKTGGADIEVSGKICIFECSKEEAARHDAAADAHLKTDGRGR